MNRALLVSTILIFALGASAPQELPKPAARPSPLSTTTESCPTASRFGLWPHSWRLLPQINSGHNLAAGICDHDLRQGWPSVQAGCGAERPKSVAKGYSEERAVDLEAAVIVNEAELPELVQEGAYPGTTGTNHL